jgi:hypothetical protein
MKRWRKKEWNKFLPSTCREGSRLKRSSRKLIRNNKLSTNKKRSKLMKSWREHANNMTKY